MGTWRGYRAYAMRRHSNSYEHIRMKRRNVKLWFISPDIDI